MASAPLKQPMPEEQFMILVRRIYTLPKYGQYFKNLIFETVDRKQKTDALMQKIRKLETKLGLPKQPVNQQLTPQVYYKIQNKLKQNLIKYIEEVYPNTYSFLIVQKIYNYFGKQYGKQCEQLLHDILQRNKQMEMKKYVEKVAISKFKDYDQDGSGQIQLSQLQSKISKYGLPKIMAQGIMDKADVQKNGIISLQQFKKYTQDQILRYYKIFFNLDSDHDEKLNKHQAKQSLYEIYPHIDIENVFDKLYETMDGDKSGLINFQQWCDFLIIFPQSNLNMMINQWGMIASTMINPEESSSFVNQDLMEGTKIKNGKRNFAPIDIIRTLTFGGIAGALSRTITAPLQRIKVLYQTLYINEKCPNSMAVDLVQTYKKHGLSSLFKGNSISVFLNCLEQGLRFTIIQYSKKTYETQGSKIHPHQFLFIGIVTGVLSSLVLFPFEVLRIRFISDDLIKNVFQQARKIKQNSGWKGFYSGLTPYLMSVLPSGSFNVMSYNMLRSLLIKQSDANQPKLYKFMLIGGVAALFTNTVTYPLSLLTSRLIIMNKDIIQFKKKVKTYQVANSIFKNEGIRGFYKGYSASSYRVFIGQSVNFGTYQTLKMLWNKKNEYFKKKF